MVANHHIVRNHAQVVNAHAVADDGGFHLCTVYGGIGANFYIVADNHVPQVLNLFPTAVRTRGVAKAIGPDHYAAVQDDVVANHHARINAYAGIKDAIAADGAVFANVHLLVDDGVVPYGGVAPHIGEGAQVHALPKVGAQEPASPEAAVAFGFLLFVGHVLEEVGNGGIGVLHAHQGRGDRLLGLKVFVDDEDGSLAGIYEGLVLGIGKETEGARLAVFYLGELGGCGVLVSFNRSFQ